MTKSTTFESVHSEADAFELLLKPEYQDALRDVVEQLPKLATIAVIFGKLYDVSTEALSDGELMAALEQLIIAKTKPLTETYKQVVESAKEARYRAEENPTSIGVFGMLRILKDPVVQKNLKFIAAFLELWQQRTASAE